MFPIAPAIERLAELGERFVRKVEARLLRPTQRPLRLAHLLLAQRRAVGRGCPSLGRAAKGDHRACDDEGGLILLGARTFDGAGYGFDVVAIDALHVPAVGLEALVYLLREGDVGAAFYGNVVVVVQIAELAKAKRAGE